MNELLGRICPQDCACGKPAVISEAKALGRAAIASGRRRGTVGEGKNRELELHAPSKRCEARAMTAGIQRQNR